MIATATMAETRSVALIRRFWADHMRPQRARMALAVLFTLLLAGITALYPIVIQQSFDMFGRGDAQAAAALVRQTTALEDIAPGTRLALTLGRRPDKTVSRPLERLEMRARFDLAVSLTRSGSALTLNRHPIAIDRTPLRIQGLVGGSLYRSARAAGAPAKLVESYIRALATKLSIGRDIGADARFDMVIDRERAATGETRLGKLQLAAIDRDGKPLQLIRWTGDRVQGTATWRCCGRTWDIVTPG